ncbi:MAG: chemotaxis protein [Serpentinimonas sp.]|jgi:two-component system chemotaxis response regulator CheV|nr:chemotaxis protein [Serpentinimonas sp.]
MSLEQREIDERTNLTGSNKFEMLLFRLGTAPGSQHAELYGINVFKIREIVAMPPVTAMAGAPKHVLGVVNLRGQVIPVIDLPAVVGCEPKGLNIMLVTEYSRTTQAFAAEGVEDIVRLDWSQVLPAEAGVARGTVTSIARLDGDAANGRLAQVLDVESILRNVMPSQDKQSIKEQIDEQLQGRSVKLAPGTVILAADDSLVARRMIEQGLQAMGLPYIMTQSGKEAWEKLAALQAECDAQGAGIETRVALVLTDLEMPDMDGFTLTRKIKQDQKLRGIPVVIHSSLSGATNEQHVRSAGADAYVAKFAPDELSVTLRNVLGQG